MIGFSARLLLGSARWVAPATLFLLWVMLVLSNGGAALSDASALFMAFAVSVCWMTIACGSVDDDPHRDLLAARAGSTQRLHLGRLGAVAALSSVPLLVLAAFLAFVRGDAGAGPASLFVAIAGLFVAGTLFGLAIGTVLHRPVLRHRGLTFLAAALLLTGLILLPPVQDVLRSYDQGDAGPGLWLVLVALVVVGLAAAAGSAGAQVRSR